VSVREGWERATRPEQAYGVLEPWRPRVIESLNPRSLESCPRVLEPWNPKVLES